ncbi:MAG: hypothetical protein QOH23_1423 [Gaiellaceae bacterium]|nr:hypothetical protein [Gaiellaceae bacterium]
MTWHFEAPAERSLRKASRLAIINDDDVRASRLAELEHREGNLVRRIVVLKERHAVTPHEVTWRQVSELDERLRDVRTQIDGLRQRLSTRFES